MHLLLAIGEIQFGIPFPSEAQYAERVENTSHLHVRTHRYIPIEQVAKQQSEGKNRFFFFNGE